MTFDAHKSLGPLVTVCLWGNMLVSQATLAQPVLITSPATIGPTATTITPTAGGAAVPLATAQVTVQSTTLTINGRHTLASLTLTNSAIIDHSAGTTFDYSGSGADVFNGVSLTIAGNVLIDLSSRIDLSGAGHAGSTGEGSGALGGGPCGGGGGGHGGSGGRANCDNVLGGPANGSSTQPTRFGSGGGGYPGITNGGPGGGAIRLIVGGTLTLMGSIVADGLGPINASGGAGGSIWISASEILGSGIISANGAAEGTTNQSSGGGGGGRIAITDYCVFSPAIALRVLGGNGLNAQQVGSAGTVFLESGSRGCCPADFNGDDFLDFFDYNDYVSCFETGACPAGKSADFNDDGFADFFDYDEYVAAFEAGC